MINYCKRIVLKGESVSGMDEFFAIKLEKIHKKRHKLGKTSVTSLTYCKKYIKIEVVYIRALCHLRRDGKERIDLNYGYKQA